MKLIKIVCNTIEEEQSVMSYYKSKLLDFFRYLIYCNGKALTFNQIQILKIMQDDSYKSIILEVVSSRLSQLVDRYEEMNKETDEENPSNIVKMEP